MVTAKDLKPFSGKAKVTAHKGKGSTMTPGAPSRADINELTKRGNPASINDYSKQTPMAEDSAPPLPGLGSGSFMGR